MQKIESLVQFFCKHSIEVGVRAVDDAFTCLMDIRVKGWSYEGGARVGGT